MYSYSNCRSHTNIEYIGCSQQDQIRILNIFVLSNMAYISKQKIEYSYLNIQYFFPNIWICYTAPPSRGSPLYQGLTTSPPIQKTNFEHSCHPLAQKCPRVLHVIQLSWVSIFIKRKIIKSLHCIVGILLEFRIKILIYTNGTHLV